MLTVISNNQFKKAFKPRCSVQLHDKKESFTDFVVVGYNQVSGDTSIIQHTDTLTLGIALRLLAEAFKTSYDELTTEEKGLVDNLLQTRVAI